MGLGDFRRLRLRGRLTLRQRAGGALLAAGAVALAPAPAAAQDTAGASTGVVILEPGSVINVADMNFGRIVRPTAPGTVILTPNPTASCSVTGGLLRSGPCQAARFNIMGRRNQRVRIRENSGVVTLNGPGATMTMTNITIGVGQMHSVNGANGWNLGNYQIDAANGISEFRLGGRLNVGANQAPGVYTGTVVIQILFN
ncbi:MAG TPA: DUF4402 domain-containing protein [Croceibacterium sp.]|nr:DUF4402 domain-containing protein [Croceibacterium sp.]